MQGMSRHTAKRIKKGMRQLRVAEVYSPPRLSKEAEEHGHVGASFDIKNGFDLSTARDRRRCWHQLRELDHRCGAGMPPLWSVQHFARAELWKDEPAASHAQARRRHRALEVCYEGAQVAV